MTLINITPVVDYSLDCGDNDCDGYGCDIHSEYEGGACGVAGCDSPASSYLVEVDGVAMDMCHFHYNA